MAFIPVILGTAREERLSLRVAHAVVAEVRALGYETELVDVRDQLWGYTIAPKSEDSRTAGWRTLAGRAQGYVIVTPEYNHGYPGELKILLDGAIDEYRFKPVGFVGVSSGKLGGVRAVEQLRQVVIALRALPVNNAVYVSNAGDFANDEGVRDPQFGERVKGVLDEMATFMAR